MFQALICPSSGVCKYVVELPISLISFLVCCVLTKPRTKSANVVVQQHSRKLVNMGVLMPETCWISKKKNKNSKWHLVGFLFFSYHKMHGPINIRFIFWKRLNVCRRALLIVIANASLIDNRLLHSLRGVAKSLEHNWVLGIGVVFIETVNSVACSARANHLRSCTATCHHRRPREANIQGAAEIVKHLKILVTCFSARVSQSAGIWT